MGFIIGKENKEEVFQAQVTENADVQMEEKDKDDTAGNAEKSMESPMAEEEVVSESKDGTAVKRPRGRKSLRKK